MCPDPGLGRSQPLAPGVVAPVSAASGWGALGRWSRGFGDFREWALTGAVLGEVSPHLRALSAPDESLELSWTAGKGSPGWDCPALLPSVTRGGPWGGRWAVLTLCVCDRRITDWFGTLEIIPLQPPAMGTPSTVPGCFKPHPAWPRTPPGLSEQGSFPRRGRLSHSTLGTSRCCRDKSGSQQLRLCAEGGEHAQVVFLGAFPAPLDHWDLYQLTSRSCSSVFETWIGSLTKGFLLLPFLQKEGDKLAQD